MKSFAILVTPEHAGKRLDVFLADYCLTAQLGLSRTHVQKLIAEGKVFVKGTAKVHSNTRIKAGDQVVFSFEEKPQGLPHKEQVALEVVYEDDDVAVINKPSGMVVHPAPGNQEHTLVNALLGRFSTLSAVNPQRPGIVHRLDKETSGLLVVAKTDFAHLELSKQFAAHSIRRIYTALVKGKVEFDEQIIELPIGRHPYKRKNMAVDFSTAARYAKTRYRTILRTNRFSLLDLFPFTGRTHQLRVHLSYIGHPILGDTKYGRNNEFGRLALHARLLGFNHPVTGAALEFTSPLPEEFEAFLSVHKNKS